MIWIAVLLVLLAGVGYVKLVILKEKSEVSFTKTQLTSYYTVQKVFKESKGSYATDANAIRELYNPGPEYTQNFFFTEEEIPNFMRARLAAEYTPYLKADSFKILYVKVDLAGGLWVATINDKKEIETKSYNANY